MHQGYYIVKENTKLTENVYRMVLAGDTSGIRPGQFIEIKIDGFFLRRPISVCDADEQTVTIIYKTVGEGTKALSLIKEGSLDVLTQLGNGYDLSLSGDAPVLIGGGVGVPPLYMTAKELIRQGKKVTVILGFNTEDEIFYEEEFRALGADVYVTTVDGSYGIKGFVTEALKETDHTYFYTCGPLPMLKSVYKNTVTEGQFSLEERMGCGFGACMGCSIETKDGKKRICKEGPVFRKEELAWED